jgi:4-carboxymuconolactone decarboxylase
MGRRLFLALSLVMVLSQAAGGPDNSTANGTAPGVVQYTRDVLFHDLWLRTALAPRERSLVTVSALIASGHVAQIPYHLNRAMDNGLTQAQASEVLTHLAFYAGWPNVFSAIPVAKEVFEKRPSEGASR